MASTTGLYLLPVRSGFGKFAGRPVHLLYPTLQAQPCLSILLVYLAALETLSAKKWSPAAGREGFPEGPGIVKKEGGVGAGLGTAFIGPGGGGEGTGPASLP